MRHFKLLYAIAVFLILADALYYFTFNPKHNFSWEVPAFSAAFGFAMSILLVLVSKFIGKFIMKEETYYERFRKVR